MSQARLHRCTWCGTDPLQIAYHDEEWGVPERNSRALWEALLLDGFQAGLAWTTILRKREGFRRAFANFDPERIARYAELDVERLLADVSIVRSRVKIHGAINNARAYLDMQEGGRGLRNSRMELRRQHPSSERVAHSIRGARV